MTTETFNRAKPHVNVGTIGHLHHGKTTLTVAISAVLAKAFGGEAVGFSRLDNTPEEKKLGSTIDLAHVEYVTASRHYAHIDCPGHVDYVKNMIVGAAQMDAAILVCSAVDGPGAQTREHVLLARQAGVPLIVVYLNKADLLTSADQLERAKKAVRDLLSEYDFPGDTTPIVVGSARLAVEGDSSEYGVPSIMRLTEALESYVPLPERYVDTPFLMPIEKVSTISGVGIVVSGRIERGRILVGEELEIVGLKPTFKTTCTGVRMFHMALAPGEAGDSAGVLLRGTKAEDVERGQVLTKPGTLTPHTKFGASVYILGKDEGGRHTPFHTNYRPQFYFRTADATGQITLPEGVEMVMPGDNVEVSVTLSRPVVIDEGLRFSIRDGDRTVGVGVVVKILR